MTIGYLGLAASHHTALPAIILAPFLQMVLGNNTCTILEAADIRGLTTCDMTRQLLGALIVYASCGL